MNETILVMLQLWQGILGINPHGNMRTRSLFVFFPLFKLCVTEFPKIFRQILVDLFVITRKDNLTNVPSFIEIHENKRQR